jgi:hypothetical protein
MRLVNGLVVGKAHFRFMDTQTLDQKEVIRALTNDPVLSDIEVELSGRKFKIVDLPYNDNCVFLTLIAPLLEAFSSRVMGGNDSALDSFQPSALLKYCSESLPQMAHIVLRQTDPTLTVEDVKTLGKSPFKLASVVLAQITHNKTITDLMDFFVQAAPLWKLGVRLTTGATRQF